MQMTRRMTVAAIVALAAGVGAADERGTSTAKAGATGQDAQLVTCLMIDGFKQIEVSRYAARRAKSADVKAFAEAEVKEHVDLKAKMMKMGFKPLVTLPEAGTDKGGTGTGIGATPGTGKGIGATPGTGAGIGIGAKAGDTTADAGKGETAGGLMMIQLKREMAEQCVKTSRAMLEKKEGVEFDKAYVGQQLHAHLDLFDTVVVFRRHAGPELRAALEEAQGVIEKHIVTLEGMKKRFEGMKADARGE